MAAPEIDAVLVINVQTALASAAAIAASVADVVRRLRSRKPQPKPVFALWVGADPQISAIFNDANIPQFRDGNRRGARLHADRATPARRSTR